DVAVYTHTKTKATSLIESGATWKDSPREIAETCDIIITMIGTPSDVREVYFGNDGLLAHVKPDSVLIDMTTSKPTLAIDIYNHAKEKSLHALDAPVSGGDVEAKTETLAIMVGGDKGIFEQMLPIFEVMGNNIVY